MKLAELTLGELESALSDKGIHCSIGPFTLYLKSDAPGFAEILTLFYGETPVDLNPQSQFSDFVIRMTRPRSLRRFIRPQVRFETDSSTPFEPFPLDHSFPHFEWGLNWLIASQAHHYLMFHAAVLERNGRALLLPAVPGSGKSTLCSALMLSGWRLLSDEFGLFRPETGLLESLPRPIPLKNESIAVIKDYSSEAVLGPTFRKTRKGDVAHLRPTASSIQAAQEAVKPALIVFPQFQLGADELLHPFAKGRAFLKLSGNSFNYRLQGARGFTSVADVIDECDTWHLEFGDLENAVALLSDLIEK
jgi:HprK-related kinase A